MGLLLLILGTGLSFTRWYRLGRKLLVLDLLAAAAITFLPISTWLATPLENRFPVPNPVPAHIDGIIVLGGGEDPDATRARGVPAMPEHVLRLVTAVTLLHAHPEAQLYFSGGGGVFKVVHPTETEIVAPLMAAMGADMSRVHFESRSRNTWENFVYTKALAQPKPGQTWILVTSALHITRSVGIARKVGWPVVAYPTDYTTTGSYNDWPHVLDTNRTFSAFDGAFREWLGLAGYYATGKSSTLFPGP